MFTSTRNQGFDYKDPPYTITGKKSRTTLQSYNKGKAK